MYNLIDGRPYVIFVTVLTKDNVATYIYSYYISLRPQVYMQMFLRAELELIHRQKLKIIFVTL